MKRINKLPKEREVDLVFDLINAVALVNDSNKASLLIQDLLSKSEIKNISKRLRIAKLLLEDRTYNEIIDDMHCSYGTIAKISAWLEEAGQGVRAIINKLPKRQKEVNLAGHRFRQYKLPEVILEDYLNLKAFTQVKRVESLLKNTEIKERIFKKLNESLEEIYKERKKMKSKRKVWSDKLPHYIV